MTELTEVKEPYPVLGSPSLFSDSISIDHWLALVNIDPALRKTISNKPNSGAINLLNLLVRCAEGNDSWKKWRFKTDDDAEQKVFTPEFFIPASETELLPARFLFSLPTSNNLASARLEKIRTDDWAPENPKASTVYGGQIMTWATVHHSHPLGMSLLRPGSSGRSEPLSPEGHPYEFGIKAIVAAYSNFVIGNERTETV